jgi:hypothetical protein
MPNICQSVPSVTQSNIEFGNSAERFVASNSEFIYGDANGEIFYQPPNDGFYEAFQAKFFGSALSHRLIFECFEDGKLVSHQLRRNKSLVVIDGVKLGRKKNTYIGNEDIGKPFIKAYGGDFILDAAVLESLGLSVEDVIANAPGNIRRMNSELVHGGFEYTSMEAPSSVTYKPLPEARVPVYLFNVPDGKLLYLSADCYHYSPTSCKWFYGEGYLTELAIQNVDSSVTGKTSYRGQDTELSTFLI